MSRKDKLRDREYRAAYAESVLDTAIATQIRVLREQRQWTQEQLAAAAGMKQSRISALEDSNYSGWSIKTLKRLARAFDVPLLVEFGTFGRLLLSIRDMRREELERPSFDDDVFFVEGLGHRSAAPPAANVVTLSTWVHVKPVPPGPALPPPPNVVGFGTPQTTGSSEFTTAGF